MPFLFSTVYRYFVIKSHISSIFFIYNYQNKKKKRRTIINIILRSNDIKGTNICFNTHKICRGPDNPSGCMKNPFPPALTGS